MADVDFSEDNAQTMTLEIECGGRTFSPAHGDAATTGPRQQIRKLHERKQETELPDLLYGIVFSRLAWSKLSENEHERQPLVESYIQSLQELEGYRRDVEDLVRRACMANLEFRQGKGETHAKARDKALSAQLDQMIAKAAAHWLPTKNILDAKLVAQPVPTVQEKLHAALAEATTDFVTQFFELLAQLVDRQLFGLVEWMPNHCCNYHFFKQVIIQENDGTTSRIVGSRFTDTNAPFGFRERIIGWNEVEDRTEGQHRHRFARHEHSVMNAIHTTIRNSAVIMPPEVLPLVEHIPEWLYPLVQVIDGDIIRERIIEQETTVETWEEAVIRDEPIFGCEPAVIIGPYVLTGWGPREVGVEQARRQSIQTAATRSHNERIVRNRAPWFAIAAVAMYLVAVFLIIRLFRQEGGVVFVVLAALATVGATWQAAFDFAVARRNPMAALAAHFRAADAAFIILLSYWFIAQQSQSLSWVTPVVLVVGFIVSQFLGRQFQRPTIR
jgi:hypothetical protein